MDYIRGRALKPVLTLVKKQSNMTFNNIATLKYTLTATVSVFMCVCGCVHSLLFSKTDTKSLSKTLCLLSTHVVTGVCQILPQEEYRPKQRVSCF